MRKIRPRMKAAVILSRTFVSHAGATATYDYKSGQFLVIDPSATLGHYGRSGKSEEESEESVALYHVWFDAENECELLP